MCFRFCLITVSAFATLFLTLAAEAADSNWVNNTGAAASWGNAGNWSNGVPGAADTAFFPNTLTLPGTVSVGTQSLLNLGINTAANYTFSAGTLTLSAGAIISNTGGGTSTFSSDLGLVLTNGLTVSGQILIINGTISGSGPLIVNGPGYLRMSGNNTYTGGTIINNGTLELFPGSALGTGAITVNSGRLSISGATIQDRSLTLAGSSGYVNASSGGLLRNSTGAAVTVTASTAEVRADGGTIEALGGRAAVDFAANGIVSVGNSGTIRGIGTGAIYATGNGQLYNHGWVESDVDAIIFAGANSNIQNSSTIRSTNGRAVVLGFSGTLANLTGATVEGRVGVTLGDYGFINNEAGATIIGTEAAIRSNGSSSGFGNFGRIVGNVDFTAGKSHLIHLYQDSVIEGSLNAGTSLDTEVTIGGLGKAAPQLSSNLVTGNFLSGGQVTVQGSGFHFILDSKITASLIHNQSTLQIGNGGNTGDADANILNIGTLFFNRADTYTYSHVISGVGPITQSGTGTLILTGEVISEGGLVVEHGALQIGNGGTSGDFVGNVELKNGSTFAVCRADDFLLDRTVTGNGIIKQSGTGTLILTASNSNTGGLVVENGTLQLGNGGESGSFVGNVAVENGATFAIHRSDDLIFDQTISGQGGFAKLGANTLTLASANSYTGDTHIGGGTLIVSTNTLPTTSDVTSSGLLIFDQEFDGTFGGDITGGDLTKMGSGKVTLSGAADIGNLHVQEGHLSINGSLVANNILVDPGAVLNGSGDIQGDVTNDGVLSPGNSPGKLTIKGNLTFTKRSSLEVELAGRNLYDQVAVNGTARLDGKLRVMLLGDYVPEAGDRFSIVEAGRVIGRFATSELPATLGLDIIYSSTSVDLLVEGRIATYAEFAQDSNQYSAALALDTLRARDLGRGTDFDRNVRPILDLLTASELPIAFDAIQPAQSQALAQIAFARSKTWLPQMSARLADIRAGANGFRSSGLKLNEMGPANAKDILVPSPENRWGVWADGSGLFSEVAGFDGLGTGDGTSAAGTVGADYRLNENLSLGFYTGYVGSWTDFGNGSEIDSNGSRFGVYSSWKSGGFYLNSVVGGELSSYDWTRRITFPGIDRTATADTSSQLFETLFGTGYDWQAGGLRFGLFANLEYTLLFVDSFTEEGAGALNLRIEDQDTDSLRTNFGVQLGYALPISHLTLRPSMRASWRHEYLDASRGVRSNLAGGAGPGFTTILPPTDRRDSALLNAGFALDLSDRISIYAYYTGDIAGTTGDIHAINSGVRWEF